MARLARSLTSLTLLVAVAACGTERGEEGADAGAGGSGTPAVSPTGSPSATPTGSPSATQDTENVSEALRFEATRVDGASFAGASLAGEPVVLWFWAPWCAVCRSQIPTVTSLAAEGTTVVGIGSQDSAEAIADFAAQTPGVLQLSDPEGALWQRFGITEQSSFVVLDGAGSEVLRTGYNDDGALEDTVAGLGS